MTVIGNLLMTVGAVIFVVGFLISVYLGFRRRPLWGFGLLLLPFFAQLVYWLKYRIESKKWASLFFGGFSIALIGDLAIDYPLVGVVFLITCIACLLVLYRRRILTWPLWLQGMLPSKYVPRAIASTGAKRQHDIGSYGTSDAKSENVLVYSAKRFAELLERESGILSDWAGHVSASRIRKSMDNPELIQDVRQFNAKYLPGAVKSATPLLIDWSNERCELFLQMLRTKYHLDEKSAVALLLYVHDEIEYANYVDRFKGISFGDFDGLMKEVVLSDIYSGAPPDFRYVRRVLEDFGVRIPRLTNLQSFYERTKQDLKLRQFEKGLRNDSRREYVSIEQEIKSEKTLELIGARVTSLLETSPNAYYTVGPDYSRDSRLDCYYRAHFSYTLSRAFDGHCCKCGEGMAQLEFDHFWHPKASGGNFLMRSKTGVYVNNCIPLCRSCNSSKGSRSPTEFFSEAEFMNVIERSQSINHYINEHMVDFHDPDFPSRAF